MVQASKCGVNLPTISDSLSSLKAELHRHVISPKLCLKMEKCDPDSKDDAPEEPLYPFTILFRSTYEREGDGYGWRWFTVLESTNAHDFPVAHPYSWMGLGDALPLLRLASYSPTIRLMLEDMLKESVSGIPPPGLPYFRREYRMEISSWITDSLEKQRATLAGPLRAVMARGNMMLLWGCTDIAPFYCKIVHPSVKEAAITGIVHQLFPGLVVGPFSIDAKRNVMLSWDFGMTSVECCEDQECATFREQLETEAEREALIAITAIHQRSVDYMSSLRKTHLWRDTGIESFKKGYISFVDDLTREKLIGDDLCRALKAISPAVERICDEVQLANLPSVLCHGDLRPGILTCPQGARRKRLIFDWHNSTISHPFFDIVSLREIELDSFFALWKGYCSPDEALEAFSRIDALWLGWRACRALPSHISLSPSARRICDHEEIAGDISGFLSKANEWILDEEKGS